MTEFHELVLHTVETCCEDEDNAYDNEDECIICPSCKEWACEVKCRECGDMIFESNCCG